MKNILTVKEYRAGVAKHPKNKRTRGRMNTDTEKGQSTVKVPLKQKYGNIKTNGFDSVKEYKRYQELQIMVQLGEISQLILQPKFDILFNNMKICTYKGDFQYLKAGITVVEDTKGFRTPIYMIKKKLMKIILGIEIKET